MQSWGLGLEASEKSRSDMTHFRPASDAAIQLLRTVTQDSVGGTAWWRHPGML